MKTAGQHPSAGISGTAHRTVSKGGYVGVLASKFYAGYKRTGEQIIIISGATTVRITDASGTLIAAYAKPTDPAAGTAPPGRHRPRSHETHPCPRSPETSHPATNYTLNWEEPPNRAGLPDRRRDPRSR